MGLVEAFKGTSKKHVLAHEGAKVVPRKRPNPLFFKRFLMRFDVFWSSGRAPRTPEEEEKHRLAPSCRLDCAQEKNTTFGATPSLRYICTCVCVSARVYVYACACV